VVRPAPRVLQQHQSLLKNVMVIVIVAFVVAAFSGGLLARLR
jgi:hypothetical protein